MDAINRLPEFFRQRKKNSEFSAFSSFIDQIPEAILICTLPDATIQLVNSGFINLTSFTRNALQSSLVADYLSDFINQIERLSASSVKRIIEFQSKLVCYNQSTITVDCQAIKLSSDPAFVSIQITPTAPVSESPIENKSTTEKNLIEFSSNLAAITEIYRLFAFLLDTLPAKTVAIYTSSDRQIFNRLELFGDSSSQLPGKLKLPKTLPASTELLLSLDGIEWLKPSTTNQNQTNLLGVYPLMAAKGLEYFLVLGDLNLNKFDIQLPLLILRSHLVSIVFENLQLNQEVHSSKAMDSSTSKNNRIHTYINDGLITFAPDGKVIEINVSAESILGYSSAEATGKPIASLISSSNFSIPELGSFDTKEIDLGIIYLDKRSGVTIPVQMRILLLDDNSTSPELCLILTDISENEEYRIKAKQYEQRALLGDISTMFAHEVKNPINNIHLTSNLLKLKLKGSDLEEKTDKILADCDRLSKLMDSILSFSKHTVYDIKPISVQDLINPIVDRFRPRMARNNVEINLLFSEDLPAILGDKNSLDRVFINIVTNAIQAMESEGGSITIKTQIQTNGQVLIMISDTGPGIPKDVAKSIFDPFFSTKKDGIGIGLTITKNIITAHDGSLEVDSVPGGTIFKICLPTH